MLWKCCTQYASKFGKVSSGHRTGKGQFSFQYQRREIQKKCSNYHAIVLISHASDVMLKILQGRLQQYVNQELSDVQAGFRKGRGTTHQIANSYWFMEKAREFPKTSTSASLTTLKPFTLWITTNCGKFLEMGILDHLTCLLRNLYVGQEATVRTGHGKTSWFKIRKGVQQGCILSICLFNFYAEYITQNARLDESQAGIKIVGRNINNLTYAHDTTLMSESKEELKSRWWVWKRRVKNLAWNSKLTKVSSLHPPPTPHHFMANRWVKVETVTDFIFLG